MPPISAGTMHHAAATALITAGFVALMWGLAFHHPRLRVAGALTQVVGAVIGYGG